MPSILGKEVGPIGFGLMGLTWRPNPTPYDEAVKVMKRALELGANFWNGGEFYGPPHANSLQLLEYYFNKYPEDREKVVLSIKGGVGPNGPDGSPEGIRRSVDNCLKLLNGKVKISIFEPARVDPKVPIETTVAALAEYVKEGEIGGIGLSECNAKTIQRAHDIHPISGVEVELSLFSTDPLENGIAETCGELNIPLIAYSPLSRGFLTDQIKSLDDLAKDDHRRGFPRFQPNVFDLNLQLTEEVKKIAAKHQSMTTPQAAIAWVLAQKKRPGAPVVIPIPGCTTIPRVEENLKQVELSDADLASINQKLKEITVHGGRYPDSHASMING